jgi:hypothetical protein
MAAAHDRAAHLKEGERSDASDVGQNRAHREQTMLQMRAQQAAVFGQPAAVRTVSRQVDI